MAWHVIQLTGKRDLRRTHIPLSSQVTQTVELGPITPTVVTIDQVLEAAIALFRKHWVAVCLIWWGSLQR